MNMLKGNYETREVTLDGQALDPAPSHEIWNKSPEGFMWGYNGSGPAQLALAIMYHVTESAEISLKIFQEFKREVIAPLPQADFEIEIDLRKWVYGALARYYEVQEIDSDYVKRKFLVENKSHGFTAGVLGLTEYYLREITVKAAAQVGQKETISILPHVIFSDNKRYMQALVMQDQEFAPYQDFLLSMIAQCAPKYLAFTFDGEKSLEGDETYTPVNAHLIAILTPNKRAAITVYEIEYGLEDMGWAGESNRLPELEGEITAFITPVFEAYRQSLGL